MDRSKIKTKARAKLSSCYRVIIIQYIIFGLLLFVLSHIIIHIFMYFMYAKMCFYLGLTGLVHLLLSFLFILLSLVCIPPLFLGIRYSIYRIYTYNTVNPFLFIGIAFRYFFTAWKLTFRRLFASIPELLLTLVSMWLLSKCTETASILIPILQILSFICVIFLSMKLYYYFFLEYTFFDNIDNSSKVLMLKTKKIMLGNRFQLFLLQLSFIPLFILGIIPFVLILIFSVTPFYSALLLCAWIFVYMQFAQITFYKELTKPQDTKKSPYSTYTHKDVYEATAIAESSYSHEGFDTFDTDKNINNIKKENPQKQQESFNELDYLKKLNSSNEEFDTFDVADPKDNNKK